MKRLRLIRKKYVRLLVNILFLLLWFLFVLIGWTFLRQSFFALGEVFEINFAKNIYQLMDNVEVLLSFIPILFGWVIISYEIWFGRLKAKPKITKSKD